MADIFDKVAVKPKDVFDKLAPDTTGQSNPNNTGVVGPEQTAPNAGLAGVSAPSTDLHEWDNTNPEGTYFPGEKRKKDSMGMLLPHDMPGVSEGANNAKALGGYIESGPGEVVRGLGNASQGFYGKDTTQFKQGLHQAAGGAGTTMLPALPVAAAVAPIPTVVSLATGYGVGKGARAASKGLGGDEDTQNLAEDAGNILGGTAGGKGGALLNKARPKLSNSIVGPLVKTPVSATLENSRFGRNPAQAITDEGLVGTREGVLKQADSRIKQLSDAVDQRLLNHPNAGAVVDAAPIIDSAIDNAVNAAQKTGNAGIETRLEALRTALKTQYGPTKGSPYAINQLKRQIGEVGSDVGAFKSTDPIEASAASAMADVYGGLKRAVNTHAPEVMPLNERTANLVSAKTALKRNIALDTNKSAISGMSVTNAPFKIAEKTLLSPLARTFMGRVVNAGNKLGIPPEVQNVISSQQFRAPDAPPLAPPNVPSADIPRPADFASNAQQTGETVLGGGKGVLRRPALLLGQGDVTTPPNAAGTFEHSYLNQRDAGVLPNAQGRVVPKLLGGAGPEGQKLLPERGGGSAIGLPEKSQSTLEGGRSYESPRAPLDSQLPALIRDFVEKRNPARLPDTMTNSPAKAADYQNQAALKLFGKPYDQLTVPERIRTLSEGAKLQDAVRAPKSEAQSFLDTLVGHNDSVIPEPVSRVTTPNGSGESAASQEALSRVASEQSQGIKRVRIDTRSGNETPLFGPDAVDAKAGPFDRIVQRDASGRETTLDSGQRARPEPRVFGTKDGRRVHIPKSQLKEALSEGFIPEEQ